MSFLYPRLISIRRPANQDGVGFQAAYAGDRRDDEEVVFTGLKASVQLRREGQRNPVGLPADGARPTWDILIPRDQPAAAGSIIDGDFAEDDLGRRFQIVADYYDSLGYNLRVERVKA